MESPASFSEILPALGRDAIIVIQENIGIVMTYAFSREALKEYRSRHQGDWENLDYVISELPQRRANRACIELAVMLRALDDVWDIDGGGATNWSWGTLYDKGGQPKPLSLREVLNKIIHAKDIGWDFSEPDMPVIVCTASQDDVRRDWTKAEIRVAKLGTECGIFAKEWP
jgi:hypothetical protein